MEDFFYAGGLPAFLNRLSEFLAPACMTVSGKTLGENIAGAQVWHDETIRALDRPVSPAGGTVVLRGNIAPDGAVMKASATEPRLLQHRGPVLAFESYDEMAAAVERDDLDVTPDHILVLKNAGPQGGPGMPEWGMLPIPLKLVKAGVRDMVRISDARMSGTSYGACILHVAPEAFIGGPFAFVQTGDFIELDVAARRLHLDISDDEIARRRAAWEPPQPRAARGYGAIFSEHVSQANEGCDFDVLGPGPPLTEPEIH
jgi:dihydroxy-acid dehydratase